MRRTVTAAALVVMVAAGMLAHAPAAWACTCLDLSVAEHFERAEYAFIATAMVVEERHDTMLATFSLHEVLKGRLPRTVEVTTARDQAACGVVFVGGSRYVVFAAHEDGALRTDACSGTTDNAEARAEARTLSVTDFEPPDDPGGVLASGEATGSGNRAGPIAAASLVLAGVLIGLGMRVRRSLFAIGDPR